MNYFVKNTYGQTDGKRNTLYMLTYFARTLKSTIIQSLHKLQLIYMRYLGSIRRIHRSTSLQTMFSSLYYSQMNYSVYVFICLYNVFRNYENKLTKPTQRLDRLICVVIFESPGAQQCALILTIKVELITHIFVLKLLRLVNICFQLHLPRHQKSSYNERNRFLLNIIKKLTFFFVCCQGKLMLIARLFCTKNVNVILYRTHNYLSLHDILNQLLFVIVIIAEDHVRHQHQSFSRLKSHFIK